MIFDMEKTYTGKWIMGVGTLVLMWWASLYYGALPSAYSVQIPMILLGSLLLAGTICSMVGYYLRRQKFSWLLLMLVAPFVFFFFTDAWPERSNLFLLFYYLLGPVLILVSSVAYIFVGKDR
jgi:hypothetical protein